MTVRRVGTGLAVLGAAAALALAGCTSQITTAGQDATSGGTSGSPGATATPQLAAQISSLPASGTDGVNPADPFVVHVAHGTLTSVVMTNPTGKHVTGKLSQDHTSWTTTEALGYSKTYRVRSVAQNPDGRSTVSQEKITTLTPHRQAQPTIERIGAYPLSEGKQYGVAVVPVVHFDKAIHDTAAAEKAMTVTTTPHVDGAWYWEDDHDAHWRPKSYWTPGTKVTIKADVYGVKLGHGLYGSTDTATSFRIGRKQVTVADDNAPHGVNKVRVYNAAGKVIRTMNTSMGEHGGTTANGNYINFYTLDGTYTVLGHENPASMCSDSYGLPANAPGGYGCENIPWATKISIDGIYLHELDSTVYAQDNGEDVSHGCLNLNHDNAEWFFEHSMDGDPVVIHGAKHAPTLEVWQGGDWTVPWSTWIKGGPAA